MPRDDTAIDVVLFTGEDERAACASAIIAATEAIIADVPMVADSERWFRHSRQAIQTHRDGPTLDAAGLPPLVTALAKIMPRPSAEANHQHWLDATREVQVATTPAFGLVRVDDLYDRNQARRAGQIWQRMHLWATTQGLAMQPLNQPIERVDRERQLDAPPRFVQALEQLMQRPHRAPTFMFRVGYPAREASPSPRRSVAQVLQS
ncbi:MAG: hypothetical protein FKY71_14775 [Spiribacter salinus]|uniref:Nitroreductase family protein n=1 Tax=Spiribacter salinus TaxID=1335746 RepID=A0A540VNB2_9GAMM|nr:MAG: hypothetical protein FKY71_14775 [Spiribacter salinus]